MRIAVLGSWHLASVTASCLAEIGFETLIVDNEVENLRTLANAKAPVFEPGLDELLKRHLKSTRLSLAYDFAELKNCDVLWVAIDTPVDQDDVADVGFVKAKIQAALENCRDGVGVIVSSQLPVGTTRALMRSAKKDCRWCVSPENLRLGRAVEVFMNADRVVVGVDEVDREFFKALFLKISQNLLWMSIESAEVSKHGINAFLATSVSFANELARFAVEHGADPFQVADALKSDSRIGKRAYLRPGAAFSGGTLARDVSYLRRFSTEKKLSSPLMDAVWLSNQSHEEWLKERLLVAAQGSLKNKVVGLLGLSYKPGTDSTRRSLALRVAEWAIAQGASIRAYDPRVRELPLPGVKLLESAKSVLLQCDVLYVATEHPEFKEELGTCLDSFQTLAVVDPSAFLFSGEGNFAFQVVEE